MKYTLIVINKQGASEETEHETKTAVRDSIRSWQDPQNLTVRVITSDGETIYNGNALGF